jgi:hypothetical protein
MMSTTLRRGSIVVAAALLATALVLAALAFRPGPAGAQVSGEVTNVFNGLQVSALNGFVNLGPGTGSDDGVVGVSCAGETPQGGPEIPASVVTQLTPTATMLRILHGNGTALTGPVTIVCTVDFGPATTAAAKAGAFHRG